MKISKLPRTDSIQELAKFWDSHDLTDFENELEEVTSPVFAQNRSISLRLSPKESAAIKKMAQSHGISQGELIRQWIHQRLAKAKGNESRKRTKIA